MGDLYIYIVRAMGFGTGPDAPVPSPVVLQLAHALVGRKLHESGADMTGTPMQGLQWPPPQRRQNRQHQVCLPPCVDAQCSSTCRSQSLECTQKNTSLPWPGVPTQARVAWSEPPLSLVWIEGKGFDIQSFALRVSCGMSCSMSNTTTCNA